MGATPPILRTLSGLCSTCDHAPGCVDLACATAPVQHCEQFEQLEQPGPPSLPLGHRSGAPRPEPRDLCSDCLNRPGCELRRPGGVWQCEEYA